MCPAILLTLVVPIPASAATLGAAALGRGRSVAAGLAQVAQALVLLPAAALLAGPFDPSAVAKATFLAVAYLVGTLLAVRSVVREQGRVGFATVSVSFHVAMTAAGAVLLPRQRVGRFRVRDDRHADVVWAFVHSRSFHSQLSAQEAGTDLPHVSRAQIEATVLRSMAPLLPPIRDGSMIPVI
jgi:hypothetical protein